MAARSSDLVTRNAAYSILGVHISPVFDKVAASVFAEFMPGIVDLLLLAVDYIIVTYIFDLALDDRADGNHRISDEAT